MGRADAVEETSLSVRSIPVLRGSGPSDIIVNHNPNITISITLTITVTIITLAISITVTLT